jgi:hypothetical protein
VHGLVTLLVAAPKLLIGAFEWHALVPKRKYSALVPAYDVGALMQLDAAEWPPVVVLSSPTPSPMSMMYCYVMCLRMTLTAWPHTTSEIHPPHHHPETLITIALGAAVVAVRLSLSTKLWHADCRVYV